MDGVAHCEFLMWLEQRMKKGDRVTEMEADEFFRSLRAQWTDRFVGLSFDTISANGANAAVIHYKPTPQTDTVIDPSKLYLVDSGAQYT